MDGQQGGGAQPQYSTDGKWWWDGQTWRPAHSAVQPPPAPRRRATRTTWVITCAILVAVAVILPLAAARPLLTSLGRASPPRSTPYLAGASETGIERAAAAYGLQCPAAPGAANLTQQVTRACEGRSATADTTVWTTIGPAASHVDKVVAHVGAVQPADKPAALALFQAIVIAALPGPDAAVAAAWVGEHFDREGINQTTVHGVTVVVLVEGSARSLDVVPATH